MSRRDPRVDAYIKKAAPFAQPILTHLREVIHRASPDLDETIKWGFPHFEHKGIVCAMAAFKRHTAFGFWKGGLLAKQGIPEAGDWTMGEFRRVMSLDDLPTDRTIVRLVRAAVKLNDEGVKVERKPKPKAPLKVPAYFQAALRANEKARKVFDAFSPSKQSDYVEWLTEAKSDDTRDRRLEQAIEWIAEGKSRNWKYEK